MKRHNENEFIRLGGTRAVNDFTLEKFDNKSVVEQCSTYPGENLFIHGPAGTGKTHLGTALIRKFHGLIYKPQEIYRECRGHETGDDEQRAIQYFINYSWLMIDDLGVDKKTEWSFSTLYEIIDGRYMWDKKGLIITSNLSLQALTERFMDDRISSRIIGMCKIIEITGRDRRIT